MKVAREDTQKICFFYGRTTKIRNPPLQTFVVHIYFLQFSFDEKKCFFCLVVHPLFSGLTTKKNTLFLCLPFQTQKFKFSSGSYLQSQGLFSINFFTTKSLNILKHYQEIHPIIQEIQLSYILQSPCLLREAAKKFFS